MPVGDDYKVAEEEENVGREERMTSYGQDDKNDI